MGFTALFHDQSLIVPRLCLDRTSVTLSSPQTRAASPSPLVDRAEVKKTKMTLRALSLFFFRLLMTDKFFLLFFFNSRLLTVTTKIRDSFHSLSSISNVAGENQSSTGVFCFLLSFSQLNFHF